MLGGGLLSAVNNMRLSPAVLDHMLASPASLRRLVIRPDLDAKALGMTKIKKIIVNDATDQQKALIPAGRCMGSTDALQFIVVQCRPKHSEGRPGNSLRVSRPDAAGHD